MVQNYTGKYHELVAVLPSVLLQVHTMCNNANGTKWVIFSGIGWYYGDLSYKPFISLHVQMQCTWLAVLDTDSQYAKMEGEGQGVFITWVTAITSGSNNPEDSSYRTYPTSEVPNIHKAESLLFTGEGNSPATYSTWHKYHIHFIMVVIESWLVNRGLVWTTIEGHYLSQLSCCITFLPKSKIRTTISFSRHGNSCNHYTNVRSYPNIFLSLEN